MIGKGIGKALLLTLWLLGCGTQGKAPESTQPQPSRPTPQQQDTLTQDTTLPPGFESIHKYQYEEHKRRKKPGGG